MIRSSKKNLVQGNAGQNQAFAREGQGRDGFTIVELLIVIVVLAVLATIIAISYRAVMDNAAQKAVQADAQTMATQLSKYKAKTGAYPGALTALENVPGTQATFQYTYNAGAGTYCLTATISEASAYVASGSLEAKDGKCSGH